MITLSRFYALKLPVKTNNSKHAFIENQLLVMYLHSICSDYTLFHFEVENLREILQRNSYPSAVIKASHKIFFKQTLCSEKVMPTVPKK